MKITKQDIINEVAQQLNEEGGAMAAGGVSTGGLTSAGSGTNTYSVMGPTNSPTFGGFIGPLGKINKRKLYKRVLWKWKGAKNSDGGVGKIVEPPQGYVREEHLYTEQGDLITEKHLHEWFGQDLKQKPSWNGGKLVAIEPKCLAFPYCSQGAIDKPIKLIGETKDEMCPNCYDYCSKVAEQAGKTPEYIAKIIREKYLSL